MINSDKEGRLKAIFGVSTHCPLLPISRVCYRDTTMLLDKNAGNGFLGKLNNMLVDMMFQDPPHKWITPME